MSVSGVQGLPLEVTVVGCYYLEDKEWISRQDPYVSLEYGAANYRTKTCTDGGKNPVFQEKFIFTLLEGLQELSVVVRNSRTLSADEFIGSARIHLQKVLSQGYDDTPWPLHSKSGRHSGEVRLIMHFSGANANPYFGGQKLGKATFASSAPQYATPSGSLSQVLPYNNSVPPLVAATAAYSAAPCPNTAYPAGSTYPQQQASPYLPTPPAGYPSQVACPPAAGYPPQTYPPTPQASIYPPPGVYPPPPSGAIYPPPPPAY